jgi:hypothetical protein
MTNSNIRTVLTLLAAVLILGLLVAHGQTPHLQGSADAPRFQLYQAQWEIIPQKGATYKAESVFRIDTETGATSRIAAGVNNAGEYYEHWVSVDEPPTKAR